MGFTNKQKIYGAVLCAGFTALLVDRAYFSPTPASAARSALSAPPIAPIEPAAGADTSGASEGMISARLKAMPPLDVNQIDDAFAPSKTWIDTVQPSSGRPDQFETSHKLSAILASHNGGGAIVNGQLVRVGQSLDGFTLVGVGPRNAIFAKNNTRIELSLGN